MPGLQAIELLGDAAMALARDDGLEPTLLAILRPLADRLDVASAAVFRVADAGGRLEIVAAIGLGDPATLAAAVRNPAHPVTRSAVERAAGFDVRPVAAGGPALRSHLPLIVGTAARDRVVGVLALAHDRPTDAEARAVLGAVADLVAVAIAREGPGSTGG